MCDNSRTLCLAYELNSLSSLILSTTCLVCFVIGPMIHSSREVRKILARNDYVIFSIIYSALAAMLLFLIVFVCIAVSNWILLLLRQQRRDIGQLLLSLRFIALLSYAFGKSSVYILFSHRIHTAFKGTAFHYSKKFRNLFIMSGLLNALLFVIGVVFIHLLINNVMRLSRGVSWIRYISVLICYYVVDFALLSVALVLFNRNLFEMVTKRTLRMKLNSRAMKFEIESKYETKLDGKEKANLLEQYIRTNFPSLMMDARRMRTHSEIHTHGAHHHHLPTSTFSGSVGNNNHDALSSSLCVTHGRHGSVARNHSVPSLLPPVKSHTPDGQQHHYHLSHTHGAGSSAAASTSLTAESITHHYHYHHSAIKKDDTRGAGAGAAPHKGLIAHSEEEEEMTSNVSPPVPDRGLSSAVASAAVGRGSGNINNIHHHHLIGGSSLSTAAGHISVSDDATVLTVDSSTAMLMNERTPAAVLAKQGIVRGSMSEQTVTSYGTTSSVITDVPRQSHSLMAVHHQKSSVMSPDTMTTPATTTLKSPSLLTVVQKSSDEVDHRVVGGAFSSDVSDLKVAQDLVVDRLEFVASPVSEDRDLVGYNPLKEKITPLASRANSPNLSHRVSDISIPEGEVPTPRDLTPQTSAVSAATTSHSGGSLTSGLFQDLSVAGSAGELLKAQSAGGILTGIRRVSDLVDSTPISPAVDVNDHSRRRESSSSASSSSSTSLGGVDRRRDHDDEEDSVISQAVMSAPVSYAPAGLPRAMMGAMMATPPPPKGLVMGAMVAARKSSGHGSSLGPGRATTATAMISGGGGGGTGASGRRSSRNMMRKKMSLASDISIDFAEDTSTPDLPAASRDEMNLNHNDSHRHHSHHRLEIGAVTEEEEEEPTMTADFSTTGFTGGYDDSSRRPSDRERDEDDGLRPITPRSIIRRRSKSLKSLPNMTTANDKGRTLDTFRRSVGDDESAEPSEFGDDDETMMTKPQTRKRISFAPDTVPELGSNQDSGIDDASLDGTAVGLEPELPAIGTKMRVRSSSDGSRVPSMVYIDPGMATSVPIIEQASEKSIPDKFQSSLIRAATSDEQIHHYHHSAASTMARDSKSERMLSPKKRKSKDLDDEEMPPELEKPGSARSPSLKSPKTVPTLLGGAQAISDFVLPRVTSDMGAQRPSSGLRQNPAYHASGVTSEDEGTPGLEESGAGAPAGSSFRSSGKLNGFHQRPSTVRGPPKMQRSSMKRGLSGAASSSRLGTLKKTRSTGKILPQSRVTRDDMSVDFSRKKHGRSATTDLGSSIFLKPQRHTERRRRSSGRKSGGKSGGRKLVMKSKRPDVSDHDDYDSGNEFEIELSFDAENGGDINITKKRRRHKQKSFSSTASGMTGLGGHTSLRHRRFNEDSSTGGRHRKSGRVPVARAGVSGHHHHSGAVSGSGQRTSLVSISGAEISLDSEQSHHSSHHGMKRHSQSMTVSQTATHHLKYPKTSMGASLSLNGPILEEDSLDTRSGIGKRSRLSPTVSRSGLYSTTDMSTPGQRPLSAHVTPLRTHYGAPTSRENSEVMPNLTLAPSVNSTPIQHGNQHAGSTTANSSLGGRANSTEKSASVKQSSLRTAYSKRERNDLRVQLRKLIRDNQHGYLDDSSLELMDASIKYSILVTCIMFSSLLSILVLLGQLIAQLVNPTSSESLHSLVYLVILSDSLANFICVYISFQFSNPVYIKGCAMCRCLCDEICTTLVGNLIEKDLIAAELNRRRETDLMKWRDHFVSKLALAMEAEENGNSSTEGGIDDDDDNEDDLDDGIHQQREGMVASSLQGHSPDPGTLMGSTVPEGSAEGSFDFEGQPENTNSTGPGGLGYYPMLMVDSGVRHQRSAIDSRSVDPGTPATVESSSRGGRTSIGYGRGQGAVSHSLQFSSTVLTHELTTPISETTELGAGLLAGSSGGSGLTTTVPLKNKSLDSRVAHTPDGGFDSELETPIPSSMHGFPNTGSSPLVDRVAKMNSGGKSSASVSASPGPLSDSPAADS